MPPTVEIRRFIRSQQLTKSNPMDSNLRALLSLAVFVGGMAGAATWGHPIGWAAAWFVTSFLMAGAFAAVHEAIHGSLYRSEWANHLAGMLWGAVVLNPYASYRSFHFHHHVYTRTDNDSEPPLEVNSVAAYLLMYPWLMLALNATLARDQLLLLIGRPVVHAKRTGRRGLAVVNTLVLLVMLLGLGALVGFEWSTLVAWWIVPVVGGTIIASLTSAPEHYGCAMNVTDSFINSRSTESNALLRFVVWNANYHTAHHLAPMVTGRNLPVLQREISEQIKVSSRSYARFHIDALRALARDGRPTSIDLTTDDVIALDGADHHETYDERAGRREADDGSSVVS